MHRKQSQMAIKAALGTLSLVVLCGAAGAQGTYSVIYNFGQRDLYGYQPWSGVVLDGKGNIYGNTEQGGLYETGTVWMLSYSAQGGWSHTTLQNFGPSDGGPVTTMVRDQTGNLYGTSVSQIFELSPTASVRWRLTGLHNFSGGADGNCMDLCSVSMNSTGDLYGSTPSGGAHGSGVVFKYGPGGYTALYDFTGGDDGGYGVGEVAFDGQGNIYGTTVQGGTYGQGVVYRLSPNFLHGNTWTYTVLYSFTGALDGGNPWGGVIMGLDGNLYGTSLNGGTGAGGTVFRLTPNGDGTWSESVLYSFQQNGDGFAPYAVPTMDAAGNLYGTTSCGIEPNCNGTVYKLTPSSHGEWTETILHAFRNGLIDGQSPMFVPVAIDGSGNLYGTTTRGGLYLEAGGVVWKYTP
jgi:uncharacterized repeat protein (TIGR03803 family)